MHAHIRILRGLLCETHTPFTEIPGFDDALLVGKRAFIRSTTPFNSESAAMLCRDKDAVLKLVGGVAPSPKSRSFIDPHSSQRDLRQMKSIDEIVEATLEFLYPRVVKMNSGQGGKHVFVVSDEGEYKAALEKIFDPKSRYYDHLALVQEYIEPLCEYRVAVSAGEPRFAYAKGVFESLSGETKRSLFEMSHAVIEKTGLSWGSVDFIEGKDGRIYFLELNTKPLYEGFIAKNGGGEIKALFSKALEAKEWQVSRNISIGSSLRGSPARSRR